MIDYLQLIILGAIAGFTIFLGLPLVAFHNTSVRKKGFLNAVAIGILFFLVIEVLAEAGESVKEAVKEFAEGKLAAQEPTILAITLIGGLALGLLSLVIYERRYVVHKLAESIGQMPATAIETNAYKLALMIAIGIGVHNFSEGLAIGQEYTAGAIGLAMLLVVGFGLHNTTEGFGIAAPLVGHRPKVSFVVLVGFVGGAPTFAGTLVGSLWTLTVASVLFLSIAGGALIYVIMSMYNSGRRHTTNDVLMVGIFLGFVVGYLTEIVLTMGEHSFLS